MDNNNTLPYGAISSRNGSLHPEERHFVPGNSSSSVNNTTFNPLLVARNVGLHHQDQDRINYHFPTRHSHSSSRRSPYRIPHFYHNSHSRNGHNAALSSLNLNDSDVSLIIDNNIPGRDIQGLNSHLSGTTISNAPSNRYFHPPWSAEERTQGETSRVSNSCLDASMTGRTAAHLPIIKEETTPSGANSSVDVYKKHTGLKRRVSKDDAEENLPRLASKVLLTEEKMAAKMHNLSISNDHSYHLNGLQQANLASSNKVMSDLRYSSMTESGKDSGEHKEDDNNNMGSGDTAMFVLAPGIKEALAKNNQVLPQSVIDHLRKPCLAVIPWIPQDDVMAKISSNFNKTDDEKVADKNTDYFKNRIIGDSNHQANVITERAVHSDAMDDTFEFDEDDMDL